MGFHEHHVNLELIGEGGEFPPPLKISVSGEGVTNFLLSTITQVNYYHSSISDVCNLTLQGRIDETSRLRGSNFHLQTPF